MCRIPFKHFFSSFYRIKTMRKNFFLWHERKHFAHMEKYFFVESFQTTTLKLFIYRIFREALKIIPKFLV